ncbi:MAG: precorrin-2 C(20)-methyltransferase [Dehalococcoidia bacterium]
MTAILYGIGVGPGDPELITVKGLRLLRQADYVFLPATRTGRSYAGLIVAEYLEAQRQQVIELVCPPYRDRPSIELRWQELAELVGVQLRDNAQGVFVTEGDPSLYSTFQYLATALGRLHPEITIETVPGVPSVCAAAALAGMPLAVWDEMVTILPGIYDIELLQEHLARPGSTVLLKAGSALPRVVDSVEASGLNLDFALVRRAGRPEQEVVRGIEAIRGAQTDYFTTLLIRRKHV